MNQGKVKPSCDKLIVVPIFVPNYELKISGASTRMATYWEIATHSAYDMFPKYKYLTVNLILSPTSVFGVGISF